MDPKKLRAWWWHKQGLDGSLNGRPAAEILDRTGWARSVGGVGPYLTLASRGGISREQADASVAALEIHELPSARGCTYVVPSSHFGLALALAAGLGESQDIKTARKLGVTDQELVKLSDAVLRALQEGPLEPEEIRQRTGNAARNLGEEGKKKGLTTTLPLALGSLQVAGDIRRVPTNGRLDQQRYRYQLWQPNPLAAGRMEPEEAWARLARLYFSWIGPASLAEFQLFAGISAKAAKVAVAPLRLEPAFPGSDLLLAPEDRDAFEKVQVPERPQYALVASLDGLALHRRDLVSLSDQPVIGGQQGLKDLPSHAIFDCGTLIGLWEFDPDTGTIAWNTWVPADTDLRAAVARTEAYVRDQLGDARSFSLDSVKSRKPRIEALRKASAG